MPPHLGSQGRYPVREISLPLPVSPERGSRLVGMPQDSNGQREGGFPLRASVAS